MMICMHQTAGNVMGHPGNYYSSPYMYGTGLGHGPTLSRYRQVQNRYSVYSLNDLCFELKYTFGIS